jgi:hypothetical protein
MKGDKALYIIPHAIHAENNNIRIYADIRSTPNSNLKIWIRILFRVRLCEEPADDEAILGHCVTMR